MSTDDARTREIVARRAAAEVRSGDVVNLGVGIPALIPRFVDPDTRVFLHSENGLIGMGPPPAEQDVDPDLTNAGADPVTIVPGASFFDVVLSAAMMRGGHLDGVFMGAYQVDAEGSIANWLVSPTEIKGGIGGAMDLAVGAKRLVALLHHTTKNGDPRVVERCTMPLTAVGVVDRIITELAVIDVTDEGLVLRELLDAPSAEYVAERTGAPLIVRLDDPGRAVP